MKLTALLFAVLAVGSWTAIPGGTWQPTNPTISEIRAHLKEYVQEKATEQQKSLPAWSRYSFQFQGQEKEGHRFVFINAYCIAPPKYAKKTFVLVDDGGPCFFNIKYDPASRGFFELEFNGEA